mmetsp:Transcript_42682/g.93503  ORF Transcript_42682/g.93503 Transcript_42682/m.93503 type:complete len:369 (+) Transcript_42682:219-1325(+)
MRLAVALRVEIKLLRHPTPRRLIVIIVRAIKVILVVLLIEHKRGLGELYNVFPIGGARQIAFARIVEGFEEGGGRGALFLIEEVEPVARRVHRREERALHPAPASAEILLSVDEARNHLAQLDVGRQHRRAGRRVVLINARPVDPPECRRAGRPLLHRVEPLGPADAELGLVRALVINERASGALTPVVREEARLHERSLWVVTVFLNRLFERQQPAILLSLGMYWNVSELLDCRALDQPHRWTVYRLQPLNALPQLLYRVRRMKVSPLLIINRFYDSRIHRFECLFEPARTGITMTDCLHRCQRWRLHRRLGRCLGGCLSGCGHLLLSSIGLGGLLKLERGCAGSHDWWQAPGRERVRQCGGWCELA